MRDRFGTDAHAPSPRLRVLVVDDDARIGRAIKRALEPTYDVATFDDPHAALAALRAGDHYDIVLSDLRMPTMTGMEFEDEIRDLDPDLVTRMGFLTGEGFMEYAQRFAESRPGRVLSKPFSLEKLEALVHAFSEQLPARKR